MGKVCGPAIVCSIVRAIGRCQKMDRVMDADDRISDQLQEPLTLIWARQAGGRYRFNENMNSSSPARVARSAKLCNVNHTDTEQRHTFFILTQKSMWKHCIAVP